MHVDLKTGSLCGLAICKKNDSVHGQKQQPRACGRVSFVAIMA